MTLTCLLLGGGRDRAAIRTQPCLLCGGVKDPVYDDITFINRLFTTPNTTFVYLHHLKQIVSFHENAMIVIAHILNAWGVVCVFSTSLITPSLKILYIPQNHRSHAVQCINMDIKVAGKAGMLLTQQCPCISSVASSSNQSSFMAVIFYHLVLSHADTEHTHTMCLLH